MRRSLLAAAATAVLAAAQNYTILPNTRCHNDVGQFHNNTAYTDCESVCLQNAGAPLWTFCPPAGADGCSSSDPSGPAPGTCWCFPLSSLSSCAASTGWTSGYFVPPPPPPPPPPPADWLPLIDAGNMKFTADPPEAIGEGYYPVVANGFLGFEVGPYTQAFVNAWPWRDAGSLKLAGVYSGFNWTTPSHRAQIPKVSDVIITPEPGVTYATVGAAIDFAAGVYYNRTLVVAGSPRCADGTVIEQRSYAHRGLRELFVFEIRAFSNTSDPNWSGCTVAVQWTISPNNGLNDTALTQSVVEPTGTSASATATAAAAGAAAGAGAAPGPAVWSGTTTAPEEVGLPLRKLAVVFDAWAAAGPSTLTFTPAAPLLSVRAVLRSDIDVPGAQTPADVAAAAVATWTAYTTNNTPEQLLASHVAAMGALWQDGGVELAGNATFAAVVNASLYDIVSSLRAGHNFSTSPGGLATGAYAGHSFWDFETWMSPVLTVMHTDLARAAIQYRLDRLPASLSNAATSGYQGAMWSWESAYTGLWTAPWRQADTNENHISSDIPLSWRKFYYATGDKAFLSSAWQALNETCRFWECRMTRTDSTGPTPPGYGPACSAKDGAGNWTVHNVIPPDESRGVVDDCVYTNAGAAQTLSWCIEAAGILGIPQSTLPPLWAQMAAAPYLPLNYTLYAGGPVHQQNKGYAGQTINQADVALLQYPLGLDFGAEQNQRDLDYYNTVTDFAGMFTGDSAIACGYLALGNRSSADAQLALAFNHIEPHFNVFHETAFDNGHSQHFITGSGGLLQAFVFGYSGLRIQRLGVLSFTAQRPILPPLGVTAVTLRGLDLLGTAFNFQYDASNICVVLQASGTAGAAGGAAGAPLQLRVVGNGQVYPLTATPVCVPVQAVEVAGVGYQ